MSSHCHAEHTGNGDDHHGHDHNGHDGHAHDHSDDITPALQSYLYRQIDFEQISTLNETVPGSGAAVVKKGWDKRMDPEPDVISDADEQLLMFIPYVLFLLLYLFTLLSAVLRRS